MFPMLPAAPLPTDVTVAAALGCQPLPLPVNVVAVETPDPVPGVRSKLPVCDSVVIHPFKISGYHMLTPAR